MQRRYGFSGLYLTGKVTWIMWNIVGFRFVLEIPLLSVLLSGLPCAWEDQGVSWKKPFETSDVS